MNNNRSIAAFVFFIVLMTPVFVEAQPSAGPIAHTTAGSVQGYIGNTIYSFKNIPYGENTSSYRFQPPVPVKPWTGIREAIAFGTIAPQQTGRNDDRVSEDCLNLNVWTPALRDGKKRPVMVWFHGGAYANGTSNEDLVDGTRLSKRGDVVIVGVNHRLNVFGYLYLAQIGGKEYAESGNVGMLDLVLALQWIHDNIKEFGGDPDNILIFGQSGGGAKCATLMAMPAAQGLFHKVITQSGQQVTGRRKEAATESAMEVLKRLHISPEHLERLNTVPIDSLVWASQGMYFGPVTDDITLPRDPFYPDASPFSKNIPMIIGNNHDETAGLIGGSDSTIFSLTWELLPAKLYQHIKQFLGNLSPDSIIAKYRTIYPSYSPSDVFIAATTAGRSWRGAVIESEVRAAQNGAPTYVYQYNWKSPVNGGKWRASHGGEIAFVFDNVEFGKRYVGEGKEQQRMAEMMSDVWIAFARTGDPNIPALPQWVPFTIQDRPTLIFDLAPRMENDPRGEERKLFAPVTYVQPGTL